MQSVRDLLLTRRRSEPRSFSAAAAWTAAAGALVFAIDAGPLHPEIVPASDLHATQSLNLAVNHAVCGKAGYISTRFSLAEHLERRRDQQQIPLRRVLADQSGSVDEYCRSVTQVYVNGEASLQLLMEGFLYMAPQLSLHGLGTALSVTRAASWLAVALVASWCGASGLVTAAFLYIGVSVLRATHMELSVYSCLLVIPTIVAGAYAAAARSALHRSRWGSLGFALGAGVLTAFAVNMRTSYLPIYLLFLSVWIAVAAPAVHSDRRARALAALSLAALFVVGYVGFDFGIIDRVLPPRSAVAESSAHHSIAHPLVLGVATPVNEFAAKLGIEWDDAAGLEIARRVDPGVAYLGPRYERALRRYYVQLWKTYPSAMLRLYWFKLNRTGRGLFMGLQRAAFIPPLRLDRARRLEARSNGLLFVAPAVVAAMLGLWLGVREAAPFVLLVGLLSAAASAILVESVVIMPTFRPEYHSFLMFYFVFLPVVVCQFGLDALAAGVDVARHRWMQPRS